MKRRITLLLVLLVAATMTMVAANKKFTLVIDAGHGGHDAGAIGAVTKEKTINLNVALAFGRYVERNCPDVKVIYTRKTDVFVPLHTRADIANRNKADLFISIHTNSLPRGHVARGLETYTLGMHRAGDNLDVAKRENAVILIETDYKQRYEGFDPNSSESYIMFEFMQDKNMAKSVELAKLVQRRTCAAAGRPDKGVKQAGFLVLRETSMPSCLIELGFISTSDEEQFLNSSSGVDRLGRGIYQAFLDYKKKYDTNITVPYRAEEKPDVDIPTVVPKKEKRAAERKAEPKAEAKTEPKTSPKAETKAEEKPDTVAAAAPEPVVAETPAATDTLSVPVFKVQILASATPLGAKDAQLKGQAADSYTEGGLYKYTVGASADYSEIYQLRKSLLDRFPQAFIIAFKGGQKTDVQQAIREYRSRKAKK